MKPAQKLDTFKTVRFMAVVITGILGLYITSVLCASILRQAVAGASVYDLGLIMIFTLLCGFIVTAPLCLLVYHTSLPQPETGMFCLGFSDTHIFSPLMKG